MFSKKLDKLIYQIKEELSKLNPLLTLLSCLFTSIFLDWQNSTRLPTEYLSVYPYISTSLMPHPRTFLSQHSGDCSEVNAEFNWLWIAHPLMGHLIHNLYTGISGRTGRMLKNELIWRTTTEGNLPDMMVMLQPWILNSYGCLHKACKRS